MKLFRSAAAALVLSAGLTVAACSSKPGCSAAAQIEVVGPSSLTAMVDRGGGGSSGSSGSRSSGSGSYSGSRGSGSSSGYSGSRSSGGSSSGYSGSHSYTFTNAAGQRVTYTYPSRVGPTYSYQGHSYSYHPESYWLALGPPNPYNPYDSRNYINPFSPYYHYHLAVYGC